MKEELKIIKYTGAGNIAVTLDPGAAYEFIGFRMHLNGAGGATNLTITIDNIAGAAFDTVLDTIDMTAVTNLTWRTGGTYKDYCEPLLAGDKIVIAWTNGATRTYGLELMYRHIRAQLGA
jgi:hypothetical protein